VHIILEGIPMDRKRRGKLGNADIASGFKDLFKEGSGDDFSWPTTLPTSLYRDYPDI
jgi:hypothetical protein